MSSLRALALLAALPIAPSTARAEPEEPTMGVTYVFATVDAYTVSPVAFDVTGTLAGENVPRTFRFWTSSYFSDRSDSVEASRCDRLGLLVMTRPGRFLLTLRREDYSTGVTCTLSRQ
ncbi:hypothetical protein [Corallococcus caeni]|uniref:Secreted protein n=1 Tax=Corallococcus caeni TaxID=3082388 RepID=A0ABQ6QRZ3_9BACT|nr:hypothetical protein ASNO1_30500 [Corallococcus sp. NO1]